MLNLNYSQEENYKGNIIVDIPAIETPKTCKWFALTIISVAVTGMALIAFPLLCVCKQLILSPNLVLLFLIFAFCMIALCSIIYKADSAKVTYNKMEEARATAALYRRLLEDAIIRDIKLQEQNINEVNK